MFLKNKKAILHGGDQRIDVQEHVKKSFSVFSRMPSVERAAVNGLASVCYTQLALVESEFLFTTPIAGLTKVAQVTRSLKV